MSIVSWVATAYILTFDAFRKKQKNKQPQAYANFLFPEPLFSKFSDIFGRKWILMFGISVFLIGSVLCGAAQVSLSVIYKS